MFGKDRRAPIATLHFQPCYQFSGSPSKLTRCQQLFQGVDYQGQPQPLWRHGPAPTTIRELQFFLYVLNVPPGGIESGGAILAFVAHQDEGSIRRACQPIGAGQPVERVIVRHFAQVVDDQQTEACRNQPGLGAFLAELRRETFDRHDCVTVAETAGVPYDKLGAFIGEDGYFSMVFDFHYADLDIASGSEWFKRIPWTIPDLNEKIMCSQTALQQCGWAANFIENHDQPRATTKYLGAAQNDPDAVKTLGAMYFFLRGTPFIYQGQELGMVNFARTSPAQFDDISSIDQYDRAIQEGLTAEEALHIVDLRSRDNARTPFPWTAEQYGGFSQAKPWLAMTEEFPACNAAAQQKDSGSVLAFYRAMIRFRQEGPCSRTLIWGDITPVASSPDVIAYRRAYEGEEVWCWFNFGAAPAREAIPAGLEPVWGDTAAVQDGALVLPPHRFVLMRRTVR